MYNNIIKHIVTTGNHTADLHVIREPLCFKQKATMFMYLLHVTIKRYQLFVADVAFFLCFSTQCYRYVSLTQKVIYIKNIMIHLIHEAPLGSRTLPLLFIITLYNNKKKLHYLSQQLRKMRAKNESLPGCYKCFLITGFFFTTNAAF